MATRGSRDPGKSRRSTGNRNSFHADVDDATPLWIPNSPMVSKGSDVRNHRQTRSISPSWVRQREDSVDMTQPLWKRESQDLFGEHYEPAGRGLSRRTAHSEFDESLLDDKTVEELHSMAIVQSQDVTQNIMDCKKIVGETTALATSTMEMLHEQGGQIERTHLRVVNVEDTLTVGEKLLGSLGGMFSRRWKPKKGEKIKGPQGDSDPFRRKTGLQDRAAVLGHRNRQKVQVKSVDRYAGLSGSQVQLEMEREHQDEALSELGDMVNNLKNMTKEMNEEVEKQNVAMGMVEHDLEVIGDRVHQSYARTRHLVYR